jgi:hypothetical protein
MKGKGKYRGRKSWEQLAQAGGIYPFFDWDGLFMKAVCVETFSDPKHWCASLLSPEARVLQVFEIGFMLCRKINDRDSDYFQKLANHLVLLKNFKHQNQKPITDPLRTEILLFTTNEKRDSYTVRDLMNHLRARLKIKNELDLPRTVRRICREMGIKIQGVPGRPKNPDKKRRK